MDVFLSPFYGFPGDLGFFWEGNNPAPGMGRNWLQEGLDPLPALEKNGSRSSRFLLLSSKSRRNKSKPGVGMRRKKGKIPTQLPPGRIQEGWEALALLELISSGKSRGFGTFLEPFFFSFSRGFGSFQRRLCPQNSGHIPDLSWHTMIPFGELAWGWNGRNFKEEKDWEY